MSEQKNGVFSGWGNQVKKTSYSNSLVIRSKDSGELWGKSPQIVSERVFWIHRPGGAALWCVGVVKVENAQNFPNSLS